jgi:hypothetical protein
MDAPYVDGGGNAAAGSVDSNSTRKLPLLEKVASAYAAARSAASEASAAGLCRIPPLFALDSTGFVCSWKYIYIYLKVTNPLPVVCSTLNLLLPAHSCLAAMSSLHHVCAKVHRYSVSTFNERPLISSLLPCCRSSTAIVPLLTLL